MSWNPEQYLKFSDYRLRPAMDLIAQIPDIVVTPTTTIVDLGCGTGQVTQFLRERWQTATIYGIDNSPEMLAIAQEKFKDIQWINTSIEEWETDTPCDLIFSNAALHWLPHHEYLFLYLIANLKENGVLAIQMPNNFKAPSHTLMMEAGLAGEWQDVLKLILSPEIPVHPVSFYYDLLSPHVKSLDIWETEYTHILTGDSPITEWTKGTWLKPLLDAIPEAKRDNFQATYTNLIKKAYPARANGVTLFPFRRLFLIARV